MSFGIRWGYNTHYYCGLLEHYWSEV